MIAWLLRDLKSRLYHIYADAEVKDDINRQAQETEPLPDLVTNAYYLLGKDWQGNPKSMAGQGASGAAGDDYGSQPDGNISPD